MDNALAQTAVEPSVPMSFPGFFNLQWDERKGRLLLEISDFEREFLYLDTLSAGLGTDLNSNLCRGEKWRSRVVRFMRVGPRVLLVERNLAFRADEGGPEAQRLVQDSFAQSVLGGFDVAGEVASNGRVTVDATEFFLRDSVNAVARLKENGGGDYVLDPRRSVILPDGLRSFPRNTEVEALLTFAAKDPGPLTKSLVPEPGSVTLRLRHSLVQLPEPGFKRRAVDPRAPYFGIGYTDYGVSVGQSPYRQALMRFRLEKKDPRAARSEPVQPLVFYVERDLPGPIQRALMEGAGWWNEAFESAGYVNGFQVKVLPPDADPLDVRYNVIAWAHHVRGASSQGNAVLDPRTGEIIRAYATVSSLRWLGVQRLVEGLTAPYGEGGPGTAGMEALGLRFVSLIAAHEIGHTLGLMHNFGASALGEGPMVSIMDYASPVPDLGVNDRMDLAKIPACNATGIGPWDLVSIAYGYQDFPPGSDEAAALNGILDDARRRGLHLLTDQDTLPASSAHPQASTLDAGADPVAELARVMRVRTAALARFGEAVIPPGEALAALEDRLVPVYLLHRPQLVAVAKSIGGVRYENALRGARHEPVRSVSPEEQRRALAALLGALSPEAAGLPAAILGLIPPRPFGLPPAPDRFEGRTGGTFDALAPAAALATGVFDALWEPSRAARIVEQHALDPAQPDLPEIMDAVWAATWHHPTAATEGYAGEARRTVDAVALHGLLGLANHPKATEQTKAEVNLALANLARWLEVARADAARSPAERSHFDRGWRLITAHLANPASTTAAEKAVPPRNRL